MTVEEYGTVKWAIDTLQELIDNAENIGLYDEDVDAIKMGIDALNENNEQN